MFPSFSLPLQLFQPVHSFPGPSELIHNLRWSPPRTVVELFAELFPHLSNLLLLEQNWQISLTLYLSEALLYIYVAPAGDLSECVGGNSTNEESRKLLIPLLALQVLKQSNALKIPTGVCGTLDAVLREVRLCSLEREGEAKEPQVTSQLSLSKKRELLATEGRTFLLFFHPSIVLTNSSDDNSNRGPTYLLIPSISFLRLFFPSSKIESRTSSRGPGGGRSRIEGRDTENEVTHSPRTLNLVL